MRPLERVRIHKQTVVTHRGALLRGAPVWLYKWGKLNGYSDYSTDPGHYEQFKEAGINAVRIVCFDPWQRSHNYPHYKFEDSTLPDRNEFLQDLDRAVELTSMYGLYAVINYHDEGRYDLDPLRSFWEFVAPRYAHHQHVLYEIANEPVSWFPGDYTPQNLRDQEDIYHLIRKDAPDTHVILLSFANTATDETHVSMAEVASQLRGIDWTNASVGFHPYNTAGTSAPIVELKEKFPVINTEMDIPSGNGGGHNIQLMDDEEWGFETMERLRISWFAWNVEGRDKFRKNYVDKICKVAQQKGYLKQKIARKSWQDPFKSFFLRRPFYNFREFPLRKCCRAMGLKKIHLVALVSTAVAIALLEALMLGLLIPIARGVAAGNFAHIADLSILVRIFGEGVSDYFSSYATPFFLLCAAVFFVGMSKNVLGYVLHAMTGFLYGLYSKNLMAFSFGRYLQFGKSYYDRTSQSDMLSVIDYNHDVLNLLQGVVTMMATILTLIAYIGVMFLISWPLTVLAVLILPCVHFSLKTLVTRVSKQSELINNSNLDIYKSAYNIFSAMPLYKAYAKEERAYRNYAQCGESLRKTNYKVWRLQGIMYRGREIIFLLALLIMLTFVAFVLGENRPSELTMFMLVIFVANLALPKFGVFQDVAFQFAERRSRVLAFGRLFDDQEKFIIPDGSREFSEITGPIEFNNLTFAYPENSPVLHDISFKVEKGRMTALVGPSGAGKTTIVHLLARLYDVPPKTLSVDGTDIRNYTLNSVRRQMALVSQDPYVFNDTLRNNIIFGLDTEVSDDKLARVLTQARLARFVERLPAGLETRIGDRGINLSGGQRQRVAIARALLKEASLLILDEATSSLDSKSERLIQSAIEDAVKDRTAVVIAHRLSTVKRADWLVVLDEGRIVEQGTLTKLLANEGLFYQLWQAQKF